MVLAWFGYTLYFGLVSLSWSSSVWSGLVWSGLVWSVWSVAFLTELGAAWLVVWWLMKRGSGSVDN